MERLISKIESVTSEKYFYFFSWGYYYSAGALSYKKIENYNTNESVLGVGL
ncbi:MAG: hypothetical protein Q4P31_07530 [Andreesenia angusta]|nr:hypothetical protein [Andreesenia angusta]